MQTGVKPKATENPQDFVVVPSDQVRVAPADAEIANLLRAAARHHSEAGARAASDPSVPATVPEVDATFRATDVNEGVPAKSSFVRRALRAFAALLLALGIGAAAMSWQTFGYAAKKALVSWAPKWAIAASLPLDKLGLGANSTPSDDPAEATPAQPAAPAQNASDGGTSENTAASAVVPSDAAQQLQSMARDLANANQQVEAMKATIAELKAGQQQMARDLAKVTDKLAEQNAKAKLAAAAPRPPAQAAHRPAPVYSSTGYPSAATPAPPPPVYRPASPPYSAQASAVPPPPPAAQPYPPAPQIQPQADPGVVGSAPRPPMPLAPQ